MNNNKDLVDKIIEFGLSKEAASLYVLLLKSGSQGVMSLTKKSKLGRNIVYRLISELEDQQLISVAKKSFGKVYTAVDPIIFEGIVASKEAEVGKLKSSLNEMITSLQAFTGGSTESKIVHYQGVEGVERVNWNLTKADKEFRVFELEPLHYNVKDNFAEKLINIWAKNKTISHDITNQTSINPYKKNNESWHQYSKYRYIEKKILDIKFEMFIYNNVVTLLDYKAEIPHCVEIHNQALADMQRQLYDVIWAQATEMKIEKGTGRRYV